MKYRVGDLTCQLLIIVQIINFAVINCVDLVMAYLEEPQ